MTARIVVYQLTGAEPTPIEEFAVDALTEITIGREPGSTVQLDAADDDGVSPRHCRIRIAGEALRLMLSDCGGGRGTLVNGRKIETEIEVLPGDEVELGPGGPKFMFDWAAEPGLQSPRKVRLPAAENALVAAAPLLHEAAQSVGRDLVVRPAAPRGRQRGIMYGSLAALVLAILAVGAAYQMGAPPPEAAQSAQPAPVGSPLAAPAVAAGGNGNAETPATRSAAATSPAAALLPAPLQDPAIVERKPDLAGTVRKIAGASRFQILDQWIELYGVDDPTSKGEHNQAVYEYLKPFAGAVECYGKAYGRFECFGGGQNLAVIAIRRGFVRLTSDAPGEYYALVRRMASER
jgi:hypothetical protein